MKKLFLFVLLCTPFLMSSQVVVGSGVNANRMEIAIQLGLLTPDANNVITQDFIIDGNFFVMMMFTRSKTYSCLSKRILARCISW